MDTFPRSRVSSRWWASLVLVLAASLPGIGVPDRLATALHVANQRSATMNTFVIIFRQGPRTLADTDKQRRAQETTVWARRQNEAGHKLDPRILEPESAHRGPERDAPTPGDAWPVTALLFLEAKDLSEAAQVAEAHPALSYGATVEVRRWAPPVPVALPSKAPAAR